MFMGGPMMSRGVGVDDLLIPLSFGPNVAQPELLCHTIYQASLQVDPTELVCTGTYQLLQQACFIADCRHSNCWVFVY